MEPEYENMFAETPAENAAPEAQAQPQGASIDPNEFQQLKAELNATKTEQQRYRDFFSGAQPQQQHDPNQFVNELLQRGPDAINPLVDQRVNQAIQQQMQIQQLTTSFNTNHSDLVPFQEEIFRKASERANQMSRMGQPVNDAQVLTDTANDYRQRLQGYQNPNQTNQLRASALGTIPGNGSTQSSQGGNFGQKLDALNDKEFAIFKQQQAAKGTSFR